MRCGGAELAEPDTVPSPKLPEHAHAQGVRQRAVVEKALPVRAQAGAEKDDENHRHDNGVVEQQQVHREQMRIEREANQRREAEQEHVAPVAAHALLAFPRQGVRQSVEPAPLRSRRLRARLRLRIAAEQARDVHRDLRLALSRTGLGLAIEPGGERGDRAKLGPGARAAGLLHGQVRWLFRRRPGQNPAEPAR